MTTYLCPDCGKELPRGGFLTVNRDGYSQRGMGEHYGKGRCMDCANAHAKTLNSPEAMERKAVARWNSQHPTRKITSTSELH